MPAVSLSGTLAAADWIQTAASSSISVRLPLASNYPGNALTSPLNPFGLRQSCPPYLAGAEAASEYINGRRADWSG